MFSAILLIRPDPILALLRLPPADAMWTRVVGLLVGYLAYYYCLAARHELRPFMRSTVTARGTLLVFFTGFVLLGLAGPTLILFGAVDAAGALWTWRALRSEGRPARNLAG